MNSDFTFLQNPEPGDIPRSFETFLDQFSGPVCIDLTGNNSKRTRTVVTLLHGNEPSGARAIHRWLLEGHQPETNLRFILGSVEAALIEPRFRCRAFPNSRDMNRCFNPPYDDAPGRIAQQILSLIEESGAEAVLDLHNTSGQSPSFAVVTREAINHERLAALFTERLVVTDLRLGSLMEQSTLERPIVTIECGGAQEPQSHETAWLGLIQFATRETLFNAELDVDLDLYHHPVRLELESGTTLAFADQPSLGVELTLLAEVDRFNFQTVPSGTHLGWVRDERVSARLKVVDAKGTNRFSDYFEVCGNKLHTREALKLFMVTTRPDIALSDCLLYAAFESEHERVHLHLEAGAPDNAV